MVPRKTGSKSGRGRIGTVLVKIRWRCGAILADSCSLCRSMRWSLNPEGILDVGGSVGSCGVRAACRVPGFSWSFEKTRLTGSYCLLKAWTSLLLFLDWRFNSDSNCLLFSFIWTARGFSRSNFFSRFVSFVSNVLRVVSISLSVC